MQSYQNVSNSQLNSFVSEPATGCKRLCKVIKMLAIHNSFVTKLLVASVANAYAKLSKCQQFTTKNLALYFLSQLQTLMQSYQNVSNSQQGCICSYCDLCCKRLCKVIKMLAIHNKKIHFDFTTRVANAYAKLSKCQQFTTQFYLIYLLQSCKRLCKVIKMLAIHNTVPSS